MDPSRTRIVSYQNEPLVVLTFAGLIIFGGLGLVVITELIGDVK